MRASIQISLKQLVLLVTLFCIFLGVGSRFVAGRHFRKMPYQTPVNSLAFSQDGKLLAIGGLDGVVKIWELSPRKQVFAIDGYGSATVSFLGGTKILIDWKKRFTHEIFVSDLYDPKPKKRPFGKRFDANYVSAIAAGARIAISRRNCIEVWDVLTHKKLSAMPHSGRPSSLVFSKDGTRLASCTSNDITLWDVRTQAVVASTPITDKYPPRVTISLDGKTIAASGYPSVRMWRQASESLEQVTLVGGSPANRVLFSNDDSLLVASGENVELWDPSSQTLCKALEVPSGNVECLSFSPSGKLLAFSVGAVILIADPITGEVLARFRPAGGDDLQFVWSIAFSLDGKKLASAVNGTTQIWDLSTGRSSDLLEQNKLISWRWYFAAFVIWLATWLALRRIEHRRRCMRNATLP